MTDKEWLDNLITPDDEQLHNFIERVGIILDSICWDENPTDDQVNAARNQAFLETL